MKALESTPSQQRLTLRLPFSHVAPAMLCAVVVGLSMKLAATRGPISGASSTPEKAVLFAREPLTLRMHSRGCSCSAARRIEPQRLLAAVSFLITAMTAQERLLFLCSTLSGFSARKYKGSLCAAFHAYEW